MDENLLWHMTVYYTKLLLPSHLDERFDGDHPYHIKWKNHFHEMNGDVEVKYEKQQEQEQLQLSARKSYIYPYIFLSFLLNSIFIIIIHNNI